MNGGARLQIHWGTPNAGGGARELAAGDHILGRDPSCDIVLDDPQVSRRHARIRVLDDATIIDDTGSRNGVYVNGERIDAAELRPGDEIGLGGVTLRLTALGLDATVAASVAESATVILDAAALAEPEAPVAPSEPGVVPEGLLAQAAVDLEDLRQAGVEVRESDYLALGGGVGSFAWADLLRNSGVPLAAITVAGVNDHAMTRYGRLCANSQIPDHERLRSHSESCPDNLWGFPGYALREAWGELRRGRARTALAPLWRVFAEPILDQTWTPRSGHVFDSMDREEARIGWREMLVQGRIRAVRKTTDGRLLAIVSQSDERRRRHIALVAAYVHLAVGYPAIQLLPDLGEFRERTGDRERVVNAYENHDHVYEHLRAHGGTVLIRGRGIVASRVIQRIVEERANNPDIQIIHLHRSRLMRGASFGRSRRRVEEQFEMQPFNWPRGCWGGEQQQQIESADDAERKRLIDVWGGTTTANRRDWRAMIAQGGREGWYRAEYGAVDSVELEDGRVVSRVSSRLAGGGTQVLAVDFVIDCTGLVAGLERSPLLADLTSTYDLPRNALEQLWVTNDFEVDAIRDGDARLYAAGVITLGGPYAAVDSFLGLQYAALRSVDAMRGEGAPGIRKLNGLYSLRQWLRWVRGVAP